MHPSQYGETDVLEMKIDLIPGAVPYKSRVKTVESGSKRKFTRLDRQVDRARSDQTVGEP